jgi:pimeloyl-ACP methyl ester carboxylesterase
MPDLPGFGGMDSFYKIGEKPNLDTMADYLAAFVKMRYRGGRFSVAGLSYGFIIVNRMLQRYPELAGRVDLLVSVVGFAHNQDFTFSPVRKRTYLLATHIFGHRVTAAVFKTLVLNPLILRNFYSKTHNAKHKFEGLDGDAKKAMTEFEITLWRINDVRTWFYTSRTFLTFDNCNIKVELPVWHVSVAADNYFDNHVVEQHMRVIFTDFHDCPADMKRHSPTVIAGKKEAYALIPSKLRSQLKKNL